MKYIIIFIFVLGLAGCSSVESEQYFLPYEDEYKNFARKSVTIDDYKDEDEC